MSFAAGRAFEHGTQGPGRAAWRGDRPAAEHPLHRRRGAGQAELRPCHGAAAGKTATTSRSCVAAPPACSTVKTPSTIFGTRITSVATSPRMVASVAGDRGHGWQFRRAAGGAQIQHGGVRFCMRPFGAEFSAGATATRTASPGSRHPDGEALGGADMAAKVAPLDFVTLNQCVVGWNWQMRCDSVQAASRLETWRSG